VHDFEPITGRIHQPPPSHQTFQARAATGPAEKSIGTHETHELAVMCDTFHPLKVTTFAKDLDDGKGVAGRGGRRERRRPELALLSASTSSNRCRPCPVGKGTT
jgi:hypothetical protein